MAVINSESEWLGDSVMGGVRGGVGGALWMLVAENVMSQPTRRRLELQERETQPHVSVVKSNIVSVCTNNSRKECQNIM